MATEVADRRYYRALLDKDPTYDGVVYYGIRTTGIFCRSICGARKPKFENCEYFSSIQAALLAGYRPCKKCRPVSIAESSSDWVARLIEAVEAEPDRRWSERDFHELGLDTSTVRRQFKKRFGMTFVAYARARRMGLACQQIRKGARIIDVQLANGFESESGFRDAFARSFGASPSQYRGEPLEAAWIESPIGSMLAISHGEALCLLEFVDRRGLERELDKLQKLVGSPMVPGSNGVLSRIREELKAYFAGASCRFETPQKWMGTPFQRSVWEELLKIPAGHTRSYQQMADRLGSPQAVRAVARANGANQLAIVVPCHRVIGSNGSLTGYAGGLARKAWLLEHERRWNLDLSRGDQRTDQLGIRSDASEAADG